MVLREDSLELRTVHLMRRTQFTCRFCLMVFAVSSSGNYEANDIPLVTVVGECDRECCVRAFPSSFAHKPAPGDFELTTLVSSSRSKVLSTWSSWLEGFVGF